MAVAQDAVSAVQTGSNVSTLSWTHTPVGTPSAVAVCTYGFASGSSADTATCSYGGVDMPVRIKASDTTPDICYIFGLANPPSGAQTVQITFSNPNYPIAQSISVTGSDTTTCFSNTATNSGSSATPTVTCTSATGELVVFIAGADPTGACADNGGAQTSISGGSVINGGEAANIGTAAGAASVAAIWDSVISNPWSAVGASFKVAGAATVIRGWDYIVDDIYPRPARSFSTAPAFVSTFRTAGIAGIAWQGPRDHVRLPPRDSFSESPAFGRAVTAAPVPISGMAWETLQECDKLPRGRFLTDPAPIAFIPQISTWSFLVGDTTFLRDAPVDSPPGFGQPAIVAPVGIAGMAWQTPLDWSKSKVSFTAPQAYAVNVAPVINTNAGIPWFEPPDRDRPATKVRVESPIAYVRPPTVFTPIAGIAWFEPPPAALGTVRVQVSFSTPPALQQPIVQIEPPPITTIYNFPFIANLGSMMNR